MSCVNGSLLNAPLSNKMMTLLDEHFDILNKETTSIIQEFIKEAEEIGGEYNKIIKDDKNIKKHLYILEFFRNHNLLSDATQRISHFNKLIQMS